MKTLSVLPPQLHKEIVGSLPEITGDQSNRTLVAALVAVGLRGHCAYVGFLLQLELGELNGYIVFFL